MQNICGHIFFYWINEQTSKYLIEPKENWNLLLQTLRKGSNFVGGLQNSVKFDSNRIDLFKGLVDWFIKRISISLFKISYLLFEISHSIELHVTHCLGFDIRARAQVERRFAKVVNVFVFQENSSLISG